MTSPALEVREVEVVYERRGRERVRAVAGASLSVERGQIVGLVGESGCGKSSLGRAAVGLVRPAAGSVVFEGREVTRPERWTGWRVIPDQVEFWRDRPFRLHDRLVYAREAPDAPWRTERLFP